MRRYRQAAGAKKRQRALNASIDTRNADELRWFWHACDAMGYPFGHLCKILLLTACRREEIARMTWAELSRRPVGVSAAWQQDEKPSAA